MSMTIDRIGLIDPIQPGRNAGRPQRANEEAKLDSINISAEAAERAEMNRVMELASAAPDTRADRIAELKAKINEPGYLNAETIERTADRILDAFFG